MNKQLYLLNNLGGAALLLSGNISYADILPPANTCSAETYSYAMPQYLSGDPSVKDQDAEIAKALLIFPHNASGQLDNGGTALERFVEARLIGSVWGTAVNTTAANSKIYTAAVLKRHVGLGPEGLGAIYVADTSTGDANTSMTAVKFIDMVSDFNIDVGQSLLPADRGISGKPSEPSLDNVVFPLVGKVGLGDLDFDEARENLFVVNLYNKTIYKINVAAGTSASPVAYPIPDNGTTGTELRPWGLEIAGGKLYAGAIYTPTDGNLSNFKAAVYQLDLVSGSWAGTPVLEFPLTYPKGAAHPEMDGTWNPWQDDYAQWNYKGEASVHPQPILSDMEMDAEGALHLGFIDRAGHQTGTANLKPDGSGELTSGVVSGELLRTWNDNGILRLENNGVAGSYTTAGTGTFVEAGRGIGAGGPNSFQGPGDGEFYWDDYVAADHSEGIHGGLALYLPGNKLAATSMNPTSSTNSGGMRAFNTTDGTAIQGFQTYSGGGGSPGKAAGVGDLELLCPPATVDLELSKAVNKSVAKRGDTVIYTLTVRNTGTSQATGVIVTDNLPDELTFISHDGATADVYDTTTGEWNVGTIQAGASNARVLNITVKIN